MNLILIYFFTVSWLDGCGVGCVAWWMKIGCHSSVEYLLLCKFRGFRHTSDRWIIWKCACFAILWGIWIERNVRIFCGWITYIDLLWDRMSFVDSLLSQAVRDFGGISLSDFRRIGRRCYINFMFISCFLWFIWFSYGRTSCSSHAS